MQTLFAGDLVLEPLLVRHAEAMFPLLTDHQLYVHLDYPPPPSVEHLRDVYARLEGRRSPDGREQWLNWIIRPSRGEPVGHVQATVLESQAAWVAYVLGRGSWGNGYATLATRRVMQHLSEDLGVQRFLATVEASNSRSIAVLQRLGFLPAGARESKANDLTASERLFVARAVGRDGER
jgi:RimJ/RimL family protein N-acetyltransferase